MVVNFPPPIPSPSDDFAPLQTLSDAPNSLEEKQQLVPPESKPESKMVLAKRTMIEALLLFGVNAVLLVLLSAAGLKFFLASEANTDELKKLTMQPLLMFVVVVLGAPLIEEILFRGTSSLVVRGIWKVRSWSRDARDNWFWIIGAISAFLFSVAHGIGDKTMHLPLPQLLMGFILWRTAMQRGLRFSILMHATYNLLPALLMLAFGGKLK